MWAVVAAILELTPGASTRRMLKAHVGHLGNKCTDQLAKEAITKGEPFFLPKPLSYLKSEI
ncbi:hypothetical protein AVEN_133168-1, partial [Araneus ventricosus]